MVNRGLRSSHSLGRSICVSRAGLVAACSTSRHLSNGCACDGPGADHQAMRAETTIKIAVSAIDCQRKIVSVNGMTPVIASKVFGMLAGLACNCAADDDKPI